MRDVVRIERILLGVLVVMSARSATASVFFEGFESATTTTDFTAFGNGDQFTSDAGLAWLVSSGSVDVVNAAAEPSNFGVFEGNYALDLAGTSFGSMSIEIPVVAGADYSLSFWFARNGFAQSASADYSVISDGEIAVIGNVQHGIAFNDYLNETASFMATASTVTLTFTNTSGTPFAGVALDSISIVPSPGATIVLGFSGLFAVRRRR